MGSYPVGFEGQISIGALDIFNGGVKNPMVVLKRVNGGIEKIRRGYCVGSMGGMGAWRKGQWWHWSGSMGHWSGSVQALVRVSGGIEKGQCRVGRPMGALVRVNGGIEKGQWGHWSGRWSGSMGHWSHSMGCIEKGQWVLVRVNGGIEKGQWGQWSVSMGALVSIAQNY